jgi:hypothetical protein
VSQETTEVDLSQQLKKISEHLTFLEKKIDTLIEQSGNRGNTQSGGFAPRRDFGPRRDFQGGPKREFQRPGGHRPGGHRPGGFRPNSGGPRSNGAPRSEGQGSYSGGHSSAPSTRYGTRTQTYGHRPAGGGYNKKPR